MSDKTCSNCGDELTSSLEREYGLCTPCAAQPVDEVPHVAEEDENRELGEFAEEAELKMDDKTTGERIHKLFGPICPDCGAPGERQRKRRGKWECLDCGER